MNLQLLIMIVLMNSSFIVQGMLLYKRAEQEQSSRMIMKKKAEAKAKQEKELAEARIRIEKELAEAKAKQEKEVAETRIRIEEAKVKAEAEKREKIMIMKKKAEAKAKREKEAAAARLRMAEAKAKAEQQFFFTTTTISDIKKLDSKINAQLLENNLIILGLNVQSTPLTIRSRYDLLMKKKLDDNERTKVENAYASLLNMLSITPFYTTSLKKLKGMSNAEMKALSNESRQKNNIVNIAALPHIKTSAVAPVDKLKLQQLASYWDKYYNNPKFGLKDFFDLLPKANRYTIADEYNEYINRNNLDALKAQERIGNISHQEYKEKLLKLKKLKEAYEKYLKENPLDPEIYERHKTAKRSQSD